MNWDRMKSDAKYIIINNIVGKIPCWHIRRFFYSACGMTISNTARIGINTIIVCPEKIKVGERTVINEYCHLDGRGGLTIMNDVSISVYTKIITASHKQRSGIFDYFCEETVIHDRVWTGCGAIILNGTVLNENSIIGAGCVFKGVAENNGIYVGNPSKLIKTRELVNEYKLKYEPYFR